MKKILVVSFLAYTCLVIANPAGNVADEVKKAFSRDERIIKLFMDYTLGVVIRHPEEQAAVGKLAQQIDSIAHEK